MFLSPYVIPEDACDVPDAGPGTAYGVSPAIALVGWKTVREE